MANKDEGSIWAQKYEKQIFWNLYHENENFKVIEENAHLKEYII